MKKQNKALEKKKEIIQQHGEHQKNKIKLLEKERLLTEQERSHIINVLENRNWKLAITLLSIIFLLHLAASTYFFYQGYRKEAVIFGIGGIGTLVLALGDALISANKLLVAAKNNEVYIKEALFLHSNKYHHGTFEIMKKGRMEYFFCDASFKDNVKRGDKVILVKIKKKFVWVYKAREDENFANQYTVEKG